MKAEPLIEDPQDVADLGARRAAIGVQLVDDEMKDVRRIGFEPLAGQIEDRRLDVPHQHDVQHAVVGDEDVGRRILHVPAAPHLAAVKAREEALGVGAGNRGPPCR